MPDCSPIQIPLPVEGFTVVVPLTQGYSATIDACDSDLLQHKWHVCRDKNLPASQAYAQRNIPVGVRRQRRISLHRVIVARMLGRELQCGEVVDHIDGNPLNNRRSNLRVCSRAQNGIGKSRYVGNKSGYKGVYRRETGKYRAQIEIQGRKIMLGQYDTAEEAYRAYCAAARQYHGEFARFE